MKTEYIIVTAKNAEKFTEEVQLKINEGWIPQGGVSITLVTSLIFAQAMILKTT